MGILSIFSRSSSADLATKDESSLGPSVDCFETKSDAQVLTSRDLAALFASGGSSVAGVGVNPATAMRYVTVYACVRLIAESIAQLPIHVYRKLPDGSKQRLTDISLADILSVAPNSWQTGFEYFEFVLAALCLRGNHYALKSIDTRGRLLELIPFFPGSVTVNRSGYDLSYTVRFEDGSTDTLPQEKIHHVRGLSLDGFTGISPVSYQRNAIGLGIAAENHGGYVFKNGAKPAGALVHPGQLSDEAYTRIKKSWNETHGGNKQGGVAVLEEGLDFKNITMSNEDAQYLETRQFQRTEICSIFRVPPHMIGDLSKSSFSNITQQSLEMVKYTFLPWCRRLETAMNRDLLSPEERRRGLYVQFLLDGLERADIETRYKVYNIGVNTGMLSPNDCRGKENMNPREGGDIYLVPLNMADSTEGVPADPQGNDADLDNPNTKKSFTVKSIAHAAASKPGLCAPLTKGALAREQLREQFAPRFRVLAEGLVATETKDLRELIATAGGQVGADFPSSSADLYRRLSDYIRAQFLGLMREYAVAVRKAALDEIGSDLELSPEELSKFVSEMLDSFALRYIGSSEGQLAAIINETLAEELPEAIEQRLSEWDATRAEKVAGREPVQQESAVSTFVWASAGITKLRWNRRGSKSCPFCKALDGKVVGIGTPFIDQGDFTPEGHESSPLKVRGPKLHAPIHRGCVCIITPERD